jgi:serine/threonine protein phosphatase 1
MADQTPGKDRATPRSWIPWRAKGGAGPASTAPGERVYAVGDVHGRYDLLERLLKQIERDHLARGPARTRLIFLGDLIDRGPASKAVVGALRAAQAASRQVIVLKGNHEDILLHCLEGDAGAQRAWLKHGGAATLRSYGLDPPAEGESAGDFAARLEERLTPDVVAWIRGLPLKAQSGGFFFCHAGVRPGVALNRQDSDDLVWIRDEFLDCVDDHGAVIVHGHSICGTEPASFHNRICVDTAAYMSGVLTAVGLEGTERWFISTGGAATTEDSAAEGAESS